jgi:hypothetical protein
MIARTLAALAFATSALAQTPTAADLAWMAGSWAHEKPGERVSEAWLGPGNGMLVGVNLTTWTSGRKTFEFLRIVDTPAGPAYLASPGGRAPVEFKLKEAGEKRVVFENAAHDFPQRILYWREGDTLVARIEGTIREKARSEEWRFVRAPGY